MVRWKAFFKSFKVEEGKNKKYESHQQAVRGKRLHRAILQSNTLALRAGLRKSKRVRATLVVEISEG